MLSRRIRSSESELIVVRTPFAMLIATLYGIASYASILYDQLSANTETLAPDALISGAILYASSACCSVRTVKPNSFASSSNMTISSAR